MKCGGAANPNAPPFSEECVKRCEKPAVYNTPNGPRCIACSEILLDAVMSPDTIIGIYLQGKGTRPATREEARKRYFRPIQ